MRQPERRRRPARRRPGRRTRVGRDADGDSGQPDRRRTAGVRPVGQRQPSDRDGRPRHSRRRCGSSPQLDGASERPTLAVRSETPHRPDLERRTASATERRDGRRVVSDSARTYRFGDANRPGLLLGLGARQAIPVIAGVLFLAVVLQTPLPPLRRRARARGRR